MWGAGFQGGGGEKGVFGGVEGGIGEGEGDTVGASRVSVMREQDAKGENYWDSPRRSRGIRSSEGEVWRVRIWGWRLLRVMLCRAWVMFLGSISELSWLGEMDWT